jgi:hypothetical protein
VPKKRRKNMGFSPECIAAIDEGTGHPTAPGRIESDAPDPLLTL